jgi:hypothetical protein
LKKSHLREQFKPLGHMCIIKICLSMLMSYETSLAATMVRWCEGGVDQGLLPPYDNK